MAKYDDRQDSLEKLRRLCRSLDENDDPRDIPIEEVRAELKQGGVDAERLTERIMANMDDVRKSERDVGDECATRSDIQGFRFRKGAEPFFVRPALLLRFALVLAAVAYFIFPRVSVKREVVRRTVNAVTPDQQPIARKSVRPRPGIFENEPPIVPPEPEIEIARRPPVREPNRPETRQPAPQRTGLNFGDASSATLVARAWAALAEEDLNAVQAYCRKARELYGQTAREMQRSLTTYPWGSKEEIQQYEALNDVGTCLYIQGEAHRIAGQTGAAAAYYTKLAEQFFYAQTLDPRGWLWRPADAAREKLEELGVR